MSIRLKRRRIYTQHAFAYVLPYVETASAHASGEVAIVPPSMPWSEESSREGRRPAADYCVEGAVEEQDFKLFKSRQHLIFGEVDGDALNARLVPVRGRRGRSRVGDEVDTQSAPLIMSTEREG